MGYSAMLTFAHLWRFQGGGIVCKVWMGSTKDLDMHILPHISQFCICGPSGYQPCAFWGHVLESMLMQEEASAHIERAVHTWGFC